MASPNYYITAIRMGSGEKEEHIRFLQCLNPSTGKTFKLFPKTVAGYIDDGRTVKVASSDGPVNVVACEPSVARLAVADVTADRRRCGGVACLR